MPRVDRRRVVGTGIHAYAKHVISEPMCKRLFGSNWNKKLVDGVVLETGSMNTGQQGSYHLIEYVVMSQCQNGMDLEGIGLILDYQCMLQWIGSL